MPQNDDGLQAEHWRKRAEQAGASKPARTRTLRPQCWKSPKKTKLWLTVRLGQKSFGTFPTNPTPESKYLLQTGPFLAPPEFLNYQPRAASISRAENGPRVEVCRLAVALDDAPDGSAGG